MGRVKFCSWGKAVVADGMNGSPVLGQTLSKKELVVGTAANMLPLNMVTRDGRTLE